MNREMKNVYKILVRKREVKDHIIDVGMDESIILKLILRQ